MHHVKSELQHGKQLDDEDDLTDDGRKSDELMGHHHAHQQHSHGMHHHQMLGYAMKDEMKPGVSDCGVPIPATKPKIWSLADTAACKTPPPSVAQHAWSGGYQQNMMNNMNVSMGMNSFALPNSGASPGPGMAHSRYGGFLGGQYHSGVQGNGQTAGFSEVQTDTPPQTPPSMKLPSVANGLVAAAAHHPQFVPNGGSSNYNGSPAYMRHEAYAAHHHPTDAAFKPFYKRLVDDPLEDGPLIFILKLFRNS